VKTEAVRQVGLEPTTTEL